MRLESRTVTTPPPLTSSRYVDVLWITARKTRSHSTEAQCEVPYTVSRLGSQTEWAKASRVRSEQWRPYTRFPRKWGWVCPLLSYQAAALLLPLAPCWRCPLPSSCTLKPNQIGQLHLSGECGCLATYLHLKDYCGEKGENILVIMQKQMTFSYLTVKRDRLFLGQKPANYWHHVYLQESVLNFHPPNVTAA